MGLFHSFSYDILQNEPEKPQLSPRETGGLSCA